MLDVRMDFVNLKEYAAVLGSGAILVMDENADIVDMLRERSPLFQALNHADIACPAGSAPRSL